jgi:hypothetical protein
VHDPVVAEKLIPKNHGFGTRRVPLETRYYEVFNRVAYDGRARLVPIRGRIFFALISLHLRGPRRGWCAADIGLRATELIAADGRRVEAFHLKDAGAHAECHPLWHLELPAAAYALADTGLGPVVVWNEPDRAEFGLIRAGHLSSQSWPCFARWAPIRNLEAS